MNRFQQLRLNVARLIAGRGLTPSPTRRPPRANRYGSGGAPGDSKLLADLMKELRAYPEGLALAAEATVWADRCITLRAKTVARMPWAIYSQRTGAKLDTSAFHNAIRYARQEFKQNLLYVWEQSLSIHGETYLEKLWQPWPLTQLPGGLRVLNAIGVTPQIYSGRLHYYEYSAEGQTVRYQPDELIVDLYPNSLDDFRGSSPMAKALDSANVKRFMKRYVLAYYRNDATPGGVITAREGTVLSQADEERLLKQWNEQFKGPDNAFSLGLLPFAVELKQFQNQPPEHQSELDESERREICGAFHVPPSMVGAGGAADPLSADNTMDAQKAGFYEAWAIPECDDIGQVVNDVILPWLDPSGDLWFEFDYTEIRSLIRQTKEHSDKVRAEYRDSAITHGELRVALGYDADPLLENCYYVEGLGPVPRENINGLWERRLPPVTVGFNPTLAPNPLLTAPSTPALPAPTADSSKDEALLPSGQPSAVLMLSLANQPDLIALQNQVRKLYGETPVEWNAPDSFHITLVHFPAITTDQATALRAALDEVDVPELSLGVGSLRVFKTPGEFAVHFRLLRNVDLLEFQELLYDLAAQLGIPTSAYSSPANYQPHVTIGYARQMVEEAAFRGGKLRLKPQSLQFAVDKTVVWDSAAEDEDEPPPSTPPQEDALDELRAWEKKTKNAGPRKPFTTYHVRPEIASGLRAKLNGVDVSDRVSIKAAFLEAQEAVQEDYRVLDLFPAVRGAAKAYDDTRAAFVEEMLRIISAGQAEDVTRRKFAGEMRAALRKYGLQAFRDGMNAVGYDPESLSAEELATFRGWQDEQSGYVTNLGAEVFKQGITEAEVAIRANLWSNVSLNTIYLLGVSAGKAEQRVEWRVSDSVIEHCDDCPRLHGHVRPLSYFMRIKLYPGSLRTQCRHGCSCSLIPTDKPVTKEPLPILVGKYVDYSGLDATEQAAVKALVLAMGDQFDEENAA